MAEIVGTITNLSDFLSKTQVCLSVKPNDPQQQIICLEADRKYSIPAFQREVPLVFNQMIAFVQSAEVERFADRFYANPDSQYLTVVASPQDQAVVVYEGIDFFDSYQREHKGDEK